MKVLLTLAKTQRLLGIAIILVAVATIINGFTIQRLPEYDTIVKIEPNEGYCDSRTPMTYFSDGGGVCGYIAPVGVVVNANLLRQLEKEDMRKRATHQWR